MPWSTPKPALLRPPSTVRNTARTTALALAVLAAGCVTPLAHLKRNVQRCCTCCSSTSYKSARLETGFGAIAHTRATAGCVWTQEAVSCARVDSPIESAENPWLSNAIRGGAACGLNRAALPWPALQHICLPYTSSVWAKACLRSLQAWQLPSDCATMSASAPVLIGAKQLQTLCRSLVRAVGCSTAEAAAVADNLVLSNVKGHDSHGVGYLPLYLRAAKRGALPINLDGPSVLSDVGPVLALDGRGGFGQVMAREAMAMGIERAAKHGTAVVTLRNSHHVARVGAWAEMCVAAGLASVHFVNVGAHAPLVAPHGGGDARLGTNPFAVGFPGEPPLVLDFATSQVALGKVRDAGTRAA